MGSAAVVDLSAILGDSLTVKDYERSDPPSQSGPDIESSLPCIDLQSLRASSGAPRKLMLDELKNAMAEWGFVQISGHGVDEELLDQAMLLSAKFFHLPLEEKLKVRVAKSFSGYSSGVSMPGRKDWREALRVWADPEDFGPMADKLWPEKEEGDKLKEIHRKFSFAMEELAVEVVELLEEALGVKKGGFSACWESLKRTYFHFNYYPPCQEEENVVGIGAHTDTSLITILHQDNVGGLEILKDGKWIAYKPRPGCFIVNIGDFLQVLSNDALPSAEHRAVVNTAKPRMSIGAFLFPKVDWEVRPAGELVDEEHPAEYRTFTFYEYMSAFINNGFSGKRTLPLFKCKTDV